MPMRAHAAAAAVALLLAAEAGRCQPLAIPQDVQVAPVQTAGGTITNPWGIASSGCAMQPTTDGPAHVPANKTLCALHAGMKEPMRFSAAAEPLCEVTGIPCGVPARAAARVAYDAATGLGRMSVTFEALNPFAVDTSGVFPNGLGGPADFPGAQTPILAMHIHQGNATTNGPIIIWYCGAAPLVFPGVPPCSQETGVLYDAYYLQDDGSYAKEPGKAFLEYVTTNAITEANAQEYLYFNLHTTFSFAVTKGKGLVRGQLLPADEERLDGEEEACS